MALKDKINIKLDEKQYQRRRKIVSAISFLLLCALFAVIIYYSKPLMQLVAEPEAFRAWIEGQGILGYFTFIAIMCLQVVVAIIPGEVVEIGAGYAFGAATGLAAVPCWHGGGFHYHIWIHQTVRTQNGGGIHLQGKNPVIEIYSKQQTTKSTDFCAVFYSWHTQGYHHVFHWA